MSYCKTLPRWAWIIVLLFWAILALGTFAYYSQVAFSQTAEAPPSKSAEILTSPTEIAIPELERLKIEKAMLELQNLELSIRNRVLELEKADAQIQTMRKQQQDVSIAGTRILQAFMTTKGLKAEEWDFNQQGWKLTRKPSAVAVKDKP